MDYARWFTTKWGIFVSLHKLKSKNTFIGLIRYSTGAFSYSAVAYYGFLNIFLKTSQYAKSTISPLGLNYSCFIKFINLFWACFNLELVPKSYAKYARSAGTYVKLISWSEEKEQHKIELPTKSILFISSYCLVTVGICSNKYFRRYRIYGKAGVRRLLGIRPTVRGVAMNPIDHPHGGRTKSHSPEVTPWGKIAKLGK